jgi:hypothetical protein
VLNKFNLEWTKFTSITTDGALSMTGKYAGLVGLLRSKLQTLNIDNFSSFHCIIHREALCCKVLHYDNVMKIVIKTINIIKQSGLNHRQFQQILSEISAQYGEIAYFTPVRWLSRGIVLKQFFELREEIYVFMKNKSKNVEELLDFNWLCDLVFLDDITSHLNELNLKLQGKDQLITELCDNIRAFQMKLMLWTNQLKNKNLSHFKSIKLLSEEKNNDNINFLQYSESIELLKNEFEERFNDLKKEKFCFDLFVNPFNIKIEDSLPELQMEIIELQCNSSLKLKFESLTNLIEFYKYVPSTLPQIRNNALRISSMFGSTYVCEQLYTNMKNNKTKHRNNISDEHLSSCMRIISANSIQPNIDKLVSNKRIQVSSTSKY